MTAFVGSRLGTVHVIVNAGRGEDALALTGSALAGGASVLQLRAKGMTDRALVGLAVEVVRACRDRGAVCLINDRVDVALAAGADGVHLGEDDLPVAAARRILGTGRVVGATARDPIAARARVAEGADYLGVGPVWATTTKDGLPPPLGPSALGAITAAVGVPVIAIGGVTIDRVRELADSGVRGVAVVGAVANAQDPADATRRLLGEVQTSLRA